MTLITKTPDKFDPKPVPSNSDILSFWSSRYVYMTFSQFIAWLKVALNFDDRYYTQSQVDNKLSTARNFSIDIDQLRTSYRACFDAKVQIASVKLLVDVVGVKYQIVKNGVTGTIRDTITLINADLTALTNTEVNNGYAINFYFTITAGKDAGGAIIKTNVI